MSSLSNSFLSRFTLVEANFEHVEVVQLVEVVEVLEFVKVRQHANYWLDQTPSRIDFENGGML